MEKYFNLKPYIAGALVGVQAAFSVVASTIFLGKTQYQGDPTTFVRAPAFIKQSVW